MANLKILSFCGSLRKDSYNKKLAIAACEEFKGLGCDVTYLDLKSLKLPLYDGDIHSEKGIPDGGQKLIDNIQTADALAIASPEYNGSISGALKNCIDWASVHSENPFRDKPILLLGTSTGWFAASKSLAHCRAILSHLGAVVIPSQVTLPHGDKVFDDKGTIIDESQGKRVKRACEELAKISKGLKGL